MAIALQNPERVCMPPPKFIADLFHLYANMRQNNESGKIFFTLFKKLMTIQHKEGKRQGMFFIEDKDEVVAEIVYAPCGDNAIAIEHTEVDESLQGKNIGYELVHRVVEYARMKGLKISPVCPFAKAVFDKKPDFGDVLNPLSP